jgi:3-deoxy-D-manno-octulosonic-acid transferase
VAEPLLAVGALTLIDTPEALASALAGCFDEPKYVHHQGLAGLAAIDSQRGALTRTLNGLGKLLKQASER